MSAEHKPGDMVKGKVLTPTGEWVPVRSLYSLDPPGTANANVGGPSLGRKWAMGFVWIVLAGWLGMGTVFGLDIVALGVAVGGLPRGFQFLGDVLGIVLGAWWYVSWLAKKRAHLRR